MKSETKTNKGRDDMRQAAEIAQMKVIQNMMKARLRGTVEILNKKVSEITMNDLSKADRDIGMLESAFELSVLHWDDLCGATDGSVYREFFYQVAEEGFPELEEAIDCAHDEIAEMIDDGWCDDGYEEQVWEVIEDSVISRLSSAISAFDREYACSVPNLNN